MGSQLSRALLRVPQIVKQAALPPHMYLQGSGTTGQRYSREWGSAFLCNSFEVSRQERKTKRRAQCARWTRKAGSMSW